MVALCCECASDNGELPLGLRCCPHSQMCLLPHRSHVVLLCVGMHGWWVCSTMKSVLSKMGWRQRVQEKMARFSCRVLKTLALVCSGALAHPSHARCIYTTRLVMSNEECASPKCAKDSTLEHSLFAACTAHMR